MHFQDRLYSGPSGLLVELLEDLKCLGNRDIGERCQIIRNVLEKLCSAYRSLGDQSVLCKKLLPELEAFHKFYCEWNDAHRNAPNDVGNYRNEQIFLMKRVRQQIRDLININQVIFEAEMDSTTFATSLYRLAEPLKEIKELPCVASFLRRASSRFFSENTSKRLQNRKPPKDLNPTHEFRLLARKACGESFEKKHASALNAWSRSNLSSLNQQFLRRYRAEFALEFQLNLEHRPAPLSHSQLERFLERCAVVLQRVK
jgi:hypothetical protein